MKRYALGAPEWVELVACILGGEKSAPELAAEFDRSVRHIRRLRAKLRRDGYRVRVPDPTPEACRAGAAVLLARRANP